MQEKSKKEFWITNISDIVVSINDLNISIRPGQRFNLLKKGSYLSEEEINKSKDCGDLFKKRKAIKLSNELLKIIPPANILLSDGGPSTCNYVYEEIKDKNLILDDYQNISDDRFVEELLELEDEDNMSKKNKIK